MKRALGITLVLTLFCAILAAAQGPPAMPTPAPELKKLDYFAGTWTATGEAKPGPMGQGGKFTETIHSSWMAGKFFLVEHTIASGVMGRSSGRPPTSRPGNGSPCGSPTTSSRCTRWNAPHRRRLRQRTLHDHGCFPNVVHLQI